MYRGSIWNKNCPILDACGVHYMDDTGHSIQEDICQHCPRARVGLRCVLETGELVMPAQYRQVREVNGIVKTRAYIRR